MGRTAQDFEIHATKNLRRYMRTFTLPQPPPCNAYDMFVLPPVTPKSKSHQNNALAVRLEQWRVLENIRPLDIPHAKIIKWLNENIPKTIKSRDDSQYILPDTLPNRFFTHKPSDITEMESWLTLPLVTVSRVLNSAFGDSTKNWNFHSGPYNPRDYALFRHQVWKPEAIEDTHKSTSGFDKREPVVMAYQTPYVLSAQEFQEFVQCTSFPDFNPATRDSIQSKHRLWAKIWDACFAAEAHWFILTSYTQWVVGSFTPGWRIAFVSSIFQYDNSSPSILEWLTYWMATGMNMPGTLTLPKVFEPITEYGNSETDISSHFAPAVRSESYWEGANEEVEGAAVEELDVCHDEGSLNTLGGPRPRNTVDMTKPNIKKWLADCGQPIHRKFDEDDLECPFDLDAEWPEEAFFHPGKPRGEWMVST